MLKIRLENLTKDFCRW